MAVKTVKSFILNQEPEQRLLVSNANSCLAFSPVQCKKLIKQVLIGEKLQIQCDIGVVFVDDQIIIKLNQEYFNNNDPTDVISFNLSDSEDFLEGEIYICLNQAERQAQAYHLSFANETSRLIIHGLLHLLNYTDDTNEERQQMHRLENQYLKNFF